MNWFIHLRPASSTFGCPTGNYPNRFQRGSKPSVKKTITHKTSTHVQTSRQAAPGGLSHPHHLYLSPSHYAHVYIYVYDYLKSKYYFFLCKIMTVSLSFSARRHKPYIASVYITRVYITRVGLKHEGRFDVQGHGLKHHPEHRTVLLFATMVLMVFLSVFTWVDVLYWTYACPWYMRGNASCKAHRYSVFTYQWYCHWRYHLQRSRRFNLFEMAERRVVGQHAKELLDTMPKRRVLGPHGKEASSWATWLDYRTRWLPELPPRLTMPCSATCWQAA